MAIAMQQCSAPIPRAKDTIPDLPDEVDNILSTALAKNPEDRFPDMESFAASLKNLLDDDLPENLPDISYLNENIESSEPEFQDTLAADLPTIAAVHPAFPEVPAGEPVTSDGLTRKQKPPFPASEESDEPLPTVVIDRKAKQQPESPADPAGKASKTNKLYTITLIVALSIIIILLFYILNRSVPVPVVNTSAPIGIESAETAAPSIEPVGTENAEIIDPTEAWYFEATAMILQYETETPKNVYVLTDVQLPYLLRNFSDEEGRFVPNYSVPAFTNGDKVIFTGNYKNGSDERGADTVWMSVKTWDGTEGWLKSNMLKRWNGE